MVSLISDLSYHRPAPTLREHSSSSLVKGLGVVRARARARRVRIGSTQTSHTNPSGNQSILDAHEHTDGSLSNFRQGQPDDNGQVVDVSSLASLRERGQAGHLDTRSRVHLWRLAVHRARLDEPRTAVRAAVDAAATPSGPRHRRTWRSASGYARDRARWNRCCSCATCRGAHSDMARVRTRAKAAPSSYALRLARFHRPSS